MGAEEWSLLGEAVEKSVRQGQLGTPRFFRCFAQNAPNDEQITLDDLLMVAQGLFQDKPEDIHTIAASDARHLTSAARWPGGQTALFVVGDVEDRSCSRIDVVLLGSQGALYYSTPTG
jgi:hypothetical protein